MSPFEVLGWQIDPQSLIASNGDRTEHLPNKAMQLLCLFAEHQGAVVSHEEIEATIWDGNRFISRKAAANAVWQLRKALADGLDPALFIETIPKRGYRLNATVTALSAPAAARGDWLKWTAGAAVLVLAVAVSWWLGAGQAEVSTYERVILTEYPGEETEPALSADGRRLAFVWSAPGQNPDVFWKYVDEIGEAPRRATNTPENETAPSWSPDGQQLAFLRIDPETRACSVHMVTLASDTEEQLGRCQATIPGTLAWSPDGRYLAFSYAAEDHHGIGLMALATRTFRELTISPQIDFVDTDVVWARDSQSLYFTRRTTSERDEIHHLTLDGVIRQLTEAPTDLYGISAGFSPGELVVAAIPAGEHKRQLMRLDSDTGAVLGKLDQGALEAFVPDFADAGSLLAYDASNVVISVGALEKGENRVRPLEAIASLSTDREPTLAPGGQAIAFTSMRSGAKEIWLHRQGEPVPKQMTSFGITSVFGPTYSPDGRYLAFLATGPQKNLQIHLLDTQTGRLTQLTTEATDHMPPAWAPDGKSLLASEKVDAVWTIHRYAMSEDLTLIGKTALTPGYFARETEAGDLFVFRLTDTALHRVAGETETLFRDGFERRDWGNWALGPDGVYAVLRSAEGDLVQHHPFDGGPPELVAQLPAAYIKDQNSLHFDPLSGRIVVAYYAMQQADIFGLRPVVRH